MASTAAPGIARKAGNGARAVVAAVLIVIGAVLAPVAVVSDWTQIELSSTDDFVATFAPLADDPQVQAFISGQVTDAINQQVDIPSLTSDLFSGLGELNLPPKAALALGALQGAATQGIQGLVGSTVDKFVASDAFSNVFSGTLRLTHSQLLKALNGDASGTVAVSRGEVGIRIGPIVAEVKKILVKNGLAFASNLPAIDKTIVIVKSDQLATVQRVYATALGIARWMPWIALAFLLGGIVVASRRRLATIWASAALLITMVVTVIALNLGLLLTIRALAASLVPAGVAEVIYNQVTAYSRNTAIAVAIAALLIGLVAWATGSRGAPLRLRTVGGGVAGRLRTTGEARRLTTGEFGSRLHAYRLPVRIVIGAAAAAVIVFARPLTIGVVLVTALCALVLLLLTELLQRPPVVAEVPVIKPAVRRRTAAATKTTK